MKAVVILANNVQELGGAQVVVHALGRIFQSHDHQCVVVGVTPHSTPHDFGSTHPISLMPEIWPLVIQNDSGNAATRVELRTIAVNNLANLLNSTAPGVVIAAQLWSLEILIDAMSQVHRSTQWRIVGQYHGAFAAAVNGRDLKRAVKLAPKCDVFAVLTREDAQAFADCGLTSVIVVANPRTWSPSSDFKRQPKKYIDFIGRFSHEKGPDLALTGFELARRDLGPDWTLRMIGSGPLEAELRELAGHQVEFVRPALNMEEIYSQSGVLLVTSRTEGAPLVIAEALAAGIPVIATDCSSGIREFFDAKQQVYTDLIARENPEEIARALIAFSSATMNEPRPISPATDDTYERWIAVFDSL